MPQTHIIAAILFAIAIVHTLAAPVFEKLAAQHTKHATVLRYLGTIELVFGFWAVVLLISLASSRGVGSAFNYLITRQYTEPLFVFVIMVMAASRPILETVTRLIQAIAKILPINPAIATIWLSLALVPLLGSYITEPAAMTIAAFMLAPLAFNNKLPEWLKYAVLAVLFVNISTGGTLSAYAAPPVLMVAKQWQWDSAFMLHHFGWKAAIAVMINASAVCYLLRSHIHSVGCIQLDKNAYSITISLIHIALLTSVVYFSHQPAIFISLFMMFLTFTKLSPAYQSPLLIKEGLLVGIFLAGLVILGGMQQWWLQPVFTGLQPVPLFFGATLLTAIIDNAALTFLGAQAYGLTDMAKYMLMAGAVTGGGLTIIANAPNPAGAAILRQHFRDHAINPGLLIVAAIPPTIVAGLLFLI